MGHSRIITKMASLQQKASGNIPVGDDDGFRKLNIKASAETQYITKYRSGEVEGKKSVFEKTLDKKETKMEMEKHEEDEAEAEPEGPSFSWGQRFDSSLPQSEYTSAQKINQYRHYYGYTPSEAPSIPARSTSRMYPELTRVG